MPHGIDPVTAVRQSSEFGRPEGREGVVTVYDDEDNYIGCMGVEVWRWLLALGDEWQAA